MCVFYVDRVQFSTSVWYTVFDSYETHFAIKVGAVLGDGFLSTDSSVVSLSYRSLVPRSHEQHEDDAGCGDWPLKKTGSSLFNQPELTDISSGGSQRSATALTTQLTRSPNATREPASECQCRAEQHAQLTRKRCGAEFDSDRRERESEGWRHGDVRSTDIVSWWCGVWMCHTHTHSASISQSTAASRHRSMVIQRP